MSSSLRSTLLFLFVCLLLISSSLLLEAKSLSRDDDDDDWDLEEEVARLNKPAIITIQTIHGEIYDCVDFYQQPAFDNPTIKRHNFKPPQEYSDDPAILEFIKIWKNGKGCPIGSVPIKRSTKDDLIRARLASKLYSSSSPQQTSNEPGFHYAGLRTKPGLQSYHGGSVKIAIYQPQVVGDHQHTEGRIKLQNNLDTIESGWMVNPTLFNDSLSRFYIYTRVGETSCFNTLCNIFVKSDPSISIGAFFDNISGHNVIYALALSIQKNKNGNWDLMTGKNDTLLGWWPIPATSKLSSESAYIEWGGQVFSPPGVATPPMGAGLSFLKGDYNSTAFCDDVTYTSVSGERIKAGLDVVEPYSDLTNPDFYKVEDLGLVDNKRFVYFGGPGGFKGD